MQQLKFEAYKTAYKTFFQRKVFEIQILTCLSLSLPLSFYALRGKSNIEIHVFLGFSRSQIHLRPASLYSILVKPSACEMCAFPIFMMRLSKSYSQPVHYFQMNPGLYSFLNNTIPASKYILKSKSLK